MSISDTNIIAMHAAILRRIVFSTYVMSRGKRCWFCDESLRYLESIPEGVREDVWHLARMGKVHPDKADGPGYKYGSFGGLFVTLHVGSIHIIATDEQLRRLKYGVKVEDSQGPAVSKIETTNLVVQPIDSVAARVAPFMENTNDH